MERMTSRGNEPGQHKLGEGFTGLHTLRLEHWRVES